MDVLDRCGWKSCRQDSATLFYGIAGLCDKHSEEWFNHKNAYIEDHDLKKKSLLKECSPEVKKYHKEIKNEKKF